MARKSFVVFGLGEFGQSVALTMAKNGYDVLAVDKRTDRVQEIADQVTRAVRADATDHEVMKSLGADEVLIPEQAMGVRIGQNLSSGNFTDIIELSSSFSMVEMKIPAAWKGKTLRELNLRALGLNIIARKNGDDVTITLDPDGKMDADAIYIVVGSNKSLEKIKEK